MIQEPVEHGMQSMGTDISPKINPLLRSLLCRSGSEDVHKRDEGSSNGKQCAEHFEEDPCCTSISTDWKGHLSHTHDVLYTTSRVPLLLHFIEKI